MSGRTIRVREGERIVDIAARTGHLPETLWSHPENEDLRELRHRPDTLSAGDEIFIPELRRKEISRPLDDVHRFRRRGVILNLDLQLTRHGEVRAELPFELEPDHGAVVKGKTDHDGRLRAKIAVQARSAILRLLPPERPEERIELDFGGLSPWDSVSGAQQRLCNIGYRNVQPSGLLDDATMAAVLHLQERVGLEPTGALDEETKAVIEVLFDSGVNLGELDPDLSDNPYFDEYGNAPPEEEPDPGWRYA